MAEEPSEFMVIPHTLNLPTRDMSAALERKRQAVLSSGFRPKRCAVPWPEPERKRPTPVPDNLLHFRK